MDLVRMFLEDLKKKRIDVVVDDRKALDFGDNVHLDWIQHGVMEIDQIFSIDENELLCHLFPQVIKFKQERGKDYKMVEADAYVRWKEIVKRNAFEEKNIDNSLIKMYRDQKMFCFYNYPLCFSHKYIHLERAGKSEDEIRDNLIFVVNMINLSLKNFLEKYKPLSTEYAHSVLSRIGQKERESIKDESEWFLRQLERVRTERVEELRERIVEVDEKIIEFEKILSEVAENNLIVKDLDEVIIENKLITKSNEHKYRVTKDIWGKTSSWKSGKKAHKEKIVEEELEKKRQEILEENEIRKKVMRRYDASRTEDFIKILTIIERRKRAFEVDLPLRFKELQIAYPMEERWKKRERGEFFGYWVEEKAIETREKLSAYEEKFVILADYDGLRKELFYLKEVRLVPFEEIKNKKEKIGYFIALIGSRLSFLEKERNVELDIPMEMERIAFLGGKKIIGFEMVEEKNLEMFKREKVVENSKNLFGLLKGKSLLTHKVLSKACSLEIENAYYFKEFFMSFRGFGSVGSYGDYKHILPLEILSKGNKVMARIFYYDDFLSIISMGDLELEDQDNIFNEHINLLENELDELLRVTKKYQSMSMNIEFMRKKFRIIKKHPKLPVIELIQKYHNYDEEFRFRFGSRSYGELFDSWRAWENNKIDVRIKIGDFIKGLKKVLDYKKLDSESEVRIDFESDKIILRGEKGKSTIKNFDYKSHLPMSVNMNRKSSLALYHYIMFKKMKQEEELRIKIFDKEESIAIVFIEIKSPKIKCEIKIEV